MTTNHHTPISNGAPANSSTVNAPLSELDSKITDHETRVSALESEFPVASGNPTEFLNGDGEWVVPAGTGASIDGHVIKDEGVALPQRASIDFVGAGVTVTNEAGGTQVSIPGGGHTIEDEGTPVTQRATINFTGAGVTVTDDSGKTKVDIPGGGHTIEDEGTPVTQRATINFTGAGVTVTDNSGKTKVDIPGGVTDHGALSGLNDDDHPQYALVAAGKSVAVARVMATANVNISNALENGDTLNGVTLATGDTVFLPFQTAAAENGLYTVPASGPASRHANYATWASLVGVTIAVTEGTVGADSLWLSKSNAAGTLGTTAINFKVMCTQAWRAEYTTYSSFADSGGTVIPWDDTIPQVTEGSQLMSLTFIPLTDTIEIETAVPIAFGVNDARGTVAIFKDGAANAIAASQAFIANSFLVGTPIGCERRIAVTPGVQVVISVRVGPGSGTGTMFVNGNSVARKYGGVSAAWLKVREVHAGA